jgi:branched-chain amino acid transport system substrate-binding protein
MDKKGWVVLTILIVAIVIIAIFAKPKASKVAIEGDTVKIGLIGPLSGEAATYGESMRQGAELAVEQINANGGIQGKPIEMIYEDGKCTGSSSVSATQKLISVDQVKFIVGAGCSGETIAAAPVAEAAKVLMLSPVSSNPAISTMGDYIFRNHPSDNESGAMVANLIIAKTNQAVVISENTDYSQGIRKVFVDSYTKAGGQLVMDEAFNTGTTDFRSLLSKVKASGVNSIFIDAQSETSFLQIANQMKELKVPAQIYTVYLTGDGIKQKASMLNGMIVVDLPNIGTAGNAATFTADYKAKFGKDANYPYFAAAAYDAVNILKEGISKNGYDSTKVKDFLYGIKSYDGAIGTYHFDTNGDVVGIALTVKKLENGQFVTAQ